MAREETAQRLRQRRSVCRLRKCVLTAIALGMIASFGCEPATVQPKPADDTGNLRSIAQVYATAHRNLGRPPRNVEELKNILAPAMTDPSTVFRSQRDGQEFVIIWGLDMMGGDLNTPTILAYERDGVDGKRMVVDCAGKVKDVSQGEFAQLKFPKGHKPNGT